jgi:hypothetical protein
MPHPSPPTGVRRQSTVKFDTIPVILGPHRYEERAAPKRGLEARMKHRVELEARDAPVRPRLVPPEGNTRLPKPKYQRPEYQKPLPGRPVEVTPLDHAIARHHGTTSNLDCLPHRLRISKEQVSATPMQRIHELTRENGYLREELAMYKDTRTALRELQERTKQAHQILNDALQDVSRRLARSERRLLDYWGVNIDDASEEAVIF